MKQISVFVENKVGRAYAVADGLAKNGINLRALSVADTTDYGIMRLITDDADKSQQILKEMGYIVQITEVIAIAMEDKPGALSFVLDVLAENNISLSYLYAFTASENGQATLVLKVDHPHTAQEVLTKQGIKVFN